MLNQTADREELTFVTVGSAIHGFPRLTNAIAALIADGRLPTSRVVVQAFGQIGNNGAFEHYEMLPQDKFGELIATADFVVCHAGAGTLLQVARARRPPIIVPRQKRFGEALDDHQFDLAVRLAERQFGVLVSDAGELLNAFSTVRHMQSTAKLASGRQLITRVAAGVKQLVGDRS